MVKNRKTHKGYGEDKKRAESTVLPRARKPADPVCCSRSLSNLALAASIGIDDPDLAAAHKGDFVTVGVTKCQRRSTRGL